MFTVNLEHDISLIAEVKTMSPFGFKSTETWDSLFELADKYGDIISIHVDPRWGGGMHLLERARRLTKKPILAKGLITNPHDVHRCIELGADMVLCTSAETVSKFQPGVCLYEPELKLDQLCKDDWSDRRRVVVVNARNPYSGNDNPDMWAYMKRLHGGMMIQASKIKSVEDVHEDAASVIVGEHLRDFVQSVITTPKSQ